MVSLGMKKPLRPVAHKQQITANQKLKSDVRHAVGMKEDERRALQSEEICSVSLMLMNLIQSILCKTSLWW